jgi:hypothetical protein
MESTGGFRRTDDNSDAISLAEKKQGSAGYLRGRSATGNGGGDSIVGTVIAG